ncbi:MAG: PAS domain S-box protein [Acidobacteria bacterium]|nr:PAS domain S-box protein [Acidobacteriota bacterium]
MQSGGKGTIEVHPDEEHDGSSALLFGIEAEKERLSLLLTIGGLIRTSTEPEKLLFEIATAVGKAFHAQRCLFNEILLERDEEIVHRDYFDGVESVAGRHKVSLYSSVTSQEMIGGRTVVNCDSKEDPRTSELFEQVYEPARERSYVAVPLMRERVWVASLWISCDRPVVWSAADVALLELIAERTWLAVEKLRNEGALRVSEEKYRSLFESIDDGFCLAEVIFDEEGRAVDCRVLETNAAYEKISPVSAGQTVREVFPDTDTDLFAVYGEVALTGQPCRLARFSASLGKWINARISRVGGDGSRQVAVVLTDITEQRNAETALREREAELKLVAEMTPLILTRVGRDLKYKFINRAGAAMFGLEPDQVIGRPIVEIMGEKAVAKIMPYANRVLSGEPVEYDMEIPYLTGTRWMRVHYVPDVNESGDIVGWLASLVDETELHKLMGDRAEAEKSLIRSQQRFQMAQEAGRVGIWDWSIDENKTYWSETTWAFYGESPGIAEPDQEFWSSHIHPEDRDRVKRRLYESVNSNSSHYRDEFRITRRDGTVLWIESKATIARDADGKATRLYGVNIDMTERRKAAEELQRAHDELELRVAERTRELAESNSALLREAEARIAGEEQRIFLLRRLVSGQEMERRRMARDIHDQLGQRLTGLRLKLESLRTLVEGQELISARVKRLQEIGAKLDSEVSFLAWELRPAVLDDLGLVEALRAFVNEWGRHFEINAEFRPLSIGPGRLDAEVETHLYRITQEALNNVAKYARAKNATVVLERRGDEILLIVEDDGVGFDINAPRKTSGSGGGLGLIGMKERASLVGGELDIESSSVGTTVYVRVPAFEVEH